MKFTTVTKTSEVTLTINMSHTEFDTFDDGIYEIIEKVLPSLEEHFGSEVTIEHADFNWGRPLVIRDDDGVELTISYTIHEDI